MLHSETYAPTAELPQNPNRCRKIVRRAPKGFAKNEAAPLQGSELLIETRRGLPMGRAVASASCSVNE